MVAATIKNRWQHFLSIECCFQQGPQCKEARLLDYSVLKRERKMSAFPKIPRVVSMCSVGCCCSPPATALLPDGSCSSGPKSSGDSCHEVLGTQQMLRGLSGYLCPYLSQGRGHSESAGLSQPSPSPWQICIFSTAWSTPHIPLQRQQHKQRKVMSKYISKHPWTILLPTAPCSHPNLI